MADDDARATIRAFWLREVKNLRDRRDSQRLELNQKPVTNREIAEVTGIPPTTLSDLLSCKRDVVPDWDRVSLIIDYLGGTTGEWVPKWRTARAAYDSLKKPDGSFEKVPDAQTRSAAGTASPESIKSTNRLTTAMEPVKLAPLPPDQTRSSPRTWVIAATAVGAILDLIVVGIWLLADHSNPGVIRPATGVPGARCLKVKDGTLSVSVFADPAGYNRLTEWPGKTRFWADADTSSPPRYRVPLTNGRYGYVGKDPHWVTPSTDCP